MACPSPILVPLEENNRTDKRGREDSKGGIEAKHDLDELFPAGWARGREYAVIAATAGPRRSGGSEKFCIQAARIFVPFAFNPSLVSIYYKEPCHLPTDTDILPGHRSAPLPT